MKGFRFYAESRDTVHDLKVFAALVPKDRKRINCLALDISDDRWRYNPSAVGTVLDTDPASLSFNSVSLDYLAKKCKRIPESLARSLHPELFAYLESD